MHDIALEVIQVRNPVSAGLQTCSITYTGAAIDLRMRISHVYVLEPVHKAGVHACS